MPFLKLGTRLRGLRPAELAKKSWRPAARPVGELRSSRSADSEDFVISGCYGMGDPLASRSFGSGRIAEGGGLPAMSR